MSLLLSYGSASDNIPQTSSISSFECRALAMNPIRSTAYPRSTKFENHGKTNGENSCFLPLMLPQIVFRMS